MARSICPAKRAPEPGGPSEQEGREADEEGSEADEEESRVALVEPSPLGNAHLTQLRADRVPPMDRVV